MPSSLSLRRREASWQSIANVATSKATGVRYLSASEIDATIPGIPITWRKSCSATASGFA